jgi:DNA/RNA non-specific endonuclease
MMHFRYSLFVHTPEIGGYQSGYPRPSGFIQGPFYPEGLDIYQAYTRDDQTAIIADIVGSLDLAMQYVNQSFDSSFYLARGHLAAKADYVYGAHQRSTFWYSYAQNCRI